MRKMKANKKYLAGLAAVALLVAGVKIPSLYAANAIEADRDCSLTVNVENATDYGEDLAYASIDVDRKSTRLNSSHSGESRMPSSA